MDLLFRDQSAAIKRKAKTKVTPKTQDPPIDDVRSTTSVDVTGRAELPDNRHAKHESALALVHNSIGPSIDERAIGWFFAEYVVDQAGYINGSSVRNIDTSLLTTMKAVGLAGLACNQRASGLLIESKKLYVSAMHRINKALKNPIEATKDSTLLAILLLSIFETVAGCGQRSIATWSQHINGAVALLRLRGPEQLKTQLGLRLFYQITTNLMTNSMHHDIPLPDHIFELRAEAAKYANREHVIWRFVEIMMNFTDFRYRVKHAAISDPQVILTTALELDRRLVANFSIQEPLWKYEVVYTDFDSDVVFAGHYHVYQDFMAAQVWNGMRTIRIMLHRIIQGALQKDAIDTLPQLSHNERMQQSEISMRVLYQMQSDILASVPQHVGYCPVSAKPGPWSQFGSLRHDLAAPDHTTYSLPMIRLSGGYALLWPLHLVGVLNISAGVRERVISNLQMLGRTMGVQQALILAERLFNMG